MSAESIARQREKNRADWRSAQWGGKLGFKRVYNGGDVAPKKSPGATYQGEPRSLTARILGDPLPGQSALDQRRAG